MYFGDDLNFPCPAGLITSAKSMEFGEKLKITCTGSAIRSEMSIGFEDYLNPPCPAGLMVKDLKGISNGLDLSGKFTVASEATVFKYLPAILTSQQVNKHELRSSGK